MIVFDKGGRVVINEFREFWDSRVCVREKKQDKLVG